MASALLLVTSRFIYYFCDQRKKAEAEKREFFACVDDDCIHGWVMYGDRERVYLHLVWHPLYLRTCDEVGIRRDISKCIVRTRICFCAFIKEEKDLLRRRENNWKQSLRWRRRRKIKMEVNECRNNERKREKEKGRWKIHQWLWHS